MKIVVTGTRGIPGIQGGVETHCEELYPLIVDEQHEIIVVRRLNYATDPTIKTYGNVIIKDIRTIRNKYIEAFLHTFLAVLYARRVGADIVHIHGIGPALLTPLVHMLGMKVVVTYHSLNYHQEKWGAIAKRILRMGEAVGIHYANHLIVISEYIRQSIQKKYSLKKNITLLHNGVRVMKGTGSTEFIRSLGLTKHNYILAVGRFSQEKGADKLVKAFKQLSPSSLKLVLAGSADHEDSYVQQLKKACQNEANICLPGFVKGEKLADLYTYARLFVLPSTHEGLPIALLEAMSCGVPVLASDIPANKEIGLPDKCYFRSGDTDDLRKALEQRMAERQDSRVEYDLSAYDWAYIALRTKGIYDSLME